MIKRFVGEDIRIPLQLSDAEINLYPQVLIYKGSDMSLLQTEDMIHKEDGLYSYNWEADDVPSKGVYVAKFKIYTDAGHTVLSADYGRAAEYMLVEDPADIIPDVYDGYGL